MSYEFLTGALGVGFVGTLLTLFLTWTKEARSDRRKRQVEHVRTQLDKLYGPLYFLSSLNEELFEHINKIHDAYRAEYEAKNWSQSEPTQTFIEKEAEATIRSGNGYAEIAIGNNAAMAELLKANYAYIDPEDAEVFLEFVRDQIRHNQEFSAGGPLKLPHRIHTRLGLIDLLHTGFIARVREKFLRKKEFLER
jgi:hypothetical protein